MEGISLNTPPGPPYFPQLRYIGLYANKAIQCRIWCEKKSVDLTRGIGAIRAMLRRCDAAALLCYAVLLLLLLL